MGFNNSQQVKLDSELPAPSLLADSMAFPTAPIVGAVGLLHDTSANNLDIAKSGVQDPEQSAAIVLSRSTTIAEPASVAAIGTNLLTGDNQWLRVDAFRSCSIQIIAGNGISAGQIVFEATNDPIAAPNGNAWLVEEDTSIAPTPFNLPFTIVANTVRMFRAPITAGWIRVRASSAFVGGTVRAIALLSQAPHIRMVQTVHQSAGSNLSTNVSAIPNIQKAISLVATDIGSAVINASNTTAIYTPAWGISSSFILGVTAISGTNATLQVTVEESANSGSGQWTPIYEFPLISNNSAISPNGIGNYNSGLYPTAGNRYRYVQTVGGAGASFTRSILRQQSNTPATVRPLKSIRSTAVASSFSYRVGPGMLLDLQVMSTVSGFLHIFDATAVPASGTLSSANAGVVVPIDVAAGIPMRLSWPSDTPLRFDNGLIAAFSTTGGLQFTPSSTALFSGRIR